MNFLREIELVSEFKTFVAKGSFEKKSYELICSNEQNRAGPWNEYKTRTSSRVKAFDN